jgi:peptidoglycan/LPS O-acetylase OafA/YrhL
MPDSTSRRTRTWADLVAIFATVIALGNAMWGPLIFTAMQKRYPQGDRGVSYNWVAFGVGGLVALLALFLAQRWPRVGRILLAVAGLMLAAVPLVYSDRGSAPSIASAVIGVAMLAAAPFLGQMPAPKRGDAAGVRS